MRVTTGQLRIIVANPSGYIDSQRTGVGPTVFANAQRQWMQAAWKSYFREQRQPAALWEEFERRATLGATSKQRAALIPGARRMLATFVRWDQRLAANPVDSFAQGHDVIWGRHILALRRDLVYLVEAGYEVRQLWTEREFGIDHADAPLMVAGLLICADADLGMDRTQGIEVWQLRDDRRRRWQRSELSGAVERLRERLDYVEQALSSPPP